MSCYRVYIEGAYCGSIPALQWLGACLSTYGQEFEAGYEFAWEVRQGKEVVQRGLAIVSAGSNPTLIMRNA